MFNSSHEAHSVLSSLAPTFLNVLKVTIQVALHVMQPLQHGDVNHKRIFTFCKTFKIFVDLSKLWICLEAIHRAPSSSTFSILEAFSYYQVRRVNYRQRKWEQKERKWQRGRGERERKIAKRDEKREVENKKYCECECVCANEREREREREREINYHFPWHLLLPFFHQLWNCKVSGDEFRYRIVWKEKKF